MNVMKLNVNVIVFIAHMEYQKHMIEMVVNDVNVKIHVVISNVLQIQNVPLISNQIQKWELHLYRFVEKVR